MKNLLSLFTRIGDKASSLGAVVSAMCFPAIASLGAAIGQGSSVSGSGALSIHSCLYWLGLA